MFRKIASAWRWLVEHERYANVDGVTFHRHANGGGWVADSATVDETAFVSRFAMVGPLAEVRRGCNLSWGVRIGVRSFVGMGTKLGYLVRVDDGSTIDHSCSIGRRSIVEHSVTVGHHVIVGSSSYLCSGSDIGENSRYGDAFYSAKGMHSQPGAKELGYGYVLGKGYVHDPVAMYAP